MEINQETIEQVRDNRIMYGPSTQNKIERWWKELHERMEAFFKNQLSSLIDRHLYDPTSDLDRCVYL